MTLDSVDVEIKIQVRTKTSYARLNQFGDVLYFSREIPRFNAQIASLRILVYEELYFNETE